MVINMCIIMAHIDKIDYGLTMGGTVAHRGFLIWPIKYWNLLFFAQKISLSINIRLGFADIPEICVLNMCIKYVY